MSKNSIKPIIYIGITIIIFLLAYFYFAKTEVVTKPVNPAFGEYIETFSSGILGSGSSIVIVLTKQIADSTQVGKEVDRNLFEFEPGIKGKTFWLDKQSVIFRPSERLPSGQIFNVRFALSKLLKVKDELSVFEYSFQVMPQNFGMTVDNVKPYVKTVLTRQKIEGSVATADFAESAGIEKMLTALQEKKSLKISWEHTTDGKIHSFAVEDVVRKDLASTVILSLNGASIGVSRSENKEVEIPALNDFKIINVNVDQGSNQHLVLQFSDPLDESQNLQGMIMIDGLNTLDYEIKDNEVRIYPPVRQAGTLNVNIMAGIKNILNYSMRSGQTLSVLFEQMVPAVKFIGKGTILPSSDGMLMPFEAVNLKAVDVRVIRIFENNVHQFYQVNDYDGSSELRRVGKKVISKKIVLENTGITDIGKWNRFTLDLTNLMVAEQGAIYQVRISFKKAYVNYLCGNTMNDQTVVDPVVIEEESDGEHSSWDSYEEYYSYYNEDGYDWNQRDNPCNPAFYSGNKRYAQRNIIGSDLGLIAKRGSDGNTVVVVNDIKSTLPVSGVQLQLYDYQKQVLGTATSDGEGKAIIQTKDIPFLLVAMHGSQRGYLKMQDGDALSISSFDAGGEKVNKGIKGFLYGERGVWRPGDSLYLCFILEDKLKLIPPAHPIVFELENPQGQVTSRLVKSGSVNGFYRLSTATSPDDPTGNWTGKVKVGGTEFTQPIRIEMVKPNRLRIRLDFGVDKIKKNGGNLAGNLQVDWLHGAPGKNLTANFEVVLSKGQTEFGQYKDFVFEDPTKSFATESKSVYEGSTDATGHAIISTAISATASAPGVLNATFRGKVYEESGNFSIDRFSIPFYPFDSFVGIKLPEGDRARGMLLTDTTQRVEIVTVDADGNLVSGDDIDVSLYKVEWKWWWDHTGDEAANFTSSNYSKLISSGNVKTINGKASWGFKIKYPDWGRYFIKAVDQKSGHSTGKFIYIDWPGWAGRARKEGQAATMLSFQTDKSLYQTGEKVNLVIPGSDKGRALVSVENGSHVIKTFWLETQAGDNKFSFDATGEMTPNAFINITLLQPHGQTINDLPIRLYGIIPLRVEDPVTHLYPELKMPDVIEPGQEVVIKVSEKTNKKMTYTLAIVDEGLLDLTHFRTPDAWSQFYQREALGVKTWDLYDEVMGSFGGRLERLLAIGGDALAIKEDDAKANRFKPVVKMLGPFTLEGGTAEHRFIMPSYIGSVKTMLVAGNNGAYGKTEKATPVRKPLMVLATLPRVLGPDEKVKLPITLFSSDKKIKQVKIDIKVYGPVQLPGGNSRTVVMKESDLTTDFELAVKSETGVAKIEVNVSSGPFKATDVIEIQVRNPNPLISKAQEMVLEDGKSWTASVVPFGVQGSNSAVVEISTLPPVNLGQRLKYLLQYPYGCIEQTTSSVFPQLYLDQLVAGTENEKITIQRNVTAGIERLKLFIRRDGGFSYWPGTGEADSWATSYAGHFLIEAELKGYYVPQDIISRWKKYQKSNAQGWRKSQYEYSSELTQAYRLYTLALSGEADLSSMNRLREAEKLSSMASWMLSAAYAKAGQPEAARKLISNISFMVAPYQEMGYSYGSDFRDKAIQLETLILLNDRVRAFGLVKEISGRLSSDHWMNTQALAWCLKSIGSFAGAEKKGEMKFKYSFQGKEVEASTKLAVSQFNLALGKVSNDFKITNTGKGVLYIRLITEGIPAAGSESSEENNLIMNVAYQDKDGKTLDVSELEQGQEFIASVTVNNPGLRSNYQNMALNQIFPSGWEINNLRLDGVEDRLKSDKPTYLDIKDDRVNTYFNLGRNQTSTFKVMLSAGYCGTFYLPSVNCEAMYDHTIYSRKKGQVVKVIKK